MKKDWLIVTVSENTKSAWVYGYYATRKKAVEEMKLSIPFLTIDRMYRKVVSLKTWLKWAEVGEITEIVLRKLPNRGRYPDES
jgi:hypothetical protein